jgi:hypothetical protein
MIPLSLHRIFSGALFVCKQENGGQVLLIRRYKINFINAVPSLYRSFKQAGPQPSINESRTRAQKRVEKI